MNGLLSPDQYPRAGFVNLPQQQQPSGGGMFGNGKFGIGQALVAALNGYLAGTRGPGQQVGINNIQMMQQMAQQRAQRQQELADYNRKRTDENTDWQTRYDYEVKNPKATEPHYFQDNSGNEYAVGADGKPVEVYHDPLQVKFVPNGMGGVVPVNLNSYTGGGASAPKPLTDDDILKMSGGQTPPASGGFPGGYL